MVSQSAPKAILFDIGGVCVRPSLSFFPPSFKQKKKERKKKTSTNPLHHSPNQTHLFTFYPFLQVLSPFSAISKHEIENNIPPDWINFAISRHPINGHWQRLERGEIKLDDAFFKGFRQDLSDENSWREFHALFPIKDEGDNGKKGRKRLYDVADATHP